MLCTMCAPGIDKKKTWTCLCGDSHCQHMAQCKICKMTKSRSDHFKDKKIKTYPRNNEKAWEKAANKLARSWVDIRSCRKCGSPVVKGYCCSNCGDTNPSSEED